MLQASMYQSQNMYPFLYVHSVYSNMIEKLMVHSNIYWSFYMQPASGQMVVIKYEPEIYIEQREIIMNDSKCSFQASEHSIPSPVTFEQMLGYDHTGAATYLVSWWSWLHDNASCQDYLMNCSNILFIFHNLFHCHGGIVNWQHTVM